MVVPYERGAEVGYYWAVNPHSVADKMTCKYPPFPNNSLFANLYFGSPHYYYSISSIKRMFFVQWHGVMYLEVLL